MAWKVDITPTAAAQLKRLDKSTQKRIYEFLKKLEQETDPFQLLIPYHSDMAGLWKKRIGDYRIVIEPNRKRLILQVMKTGHRSKIYR